MTPSRSFFAALDRFSRAGSVAVIGVGGAVVIGWLSNVPLLKSLLPDYATMKINTACAFIVAGLSLWLLRTSEPNSTTRRLARILALLLIALAALTLAEDIFALNFGIDQFILADKSQNSINIHPGRMSPITSFGFLIVGIALLGLKARRRLVAVGAHWISLVPLFLATLAIVGYVYGVSSLYQVKPFAPMALNTALTFFVLALSIKAADPMHGIVNIMASDTAGGAVTRWLLPTIPLAMVGIGWGHLLAQKAGVQDTPFTLALTVSIRILVCVIAIVLTAYALRRFELTRRRAETEVRYLNVGLEKLLEERIQQVAQLSAAITANKSLEKDCLHDGLTNIPNRRFLDAFLARQIGISRRYKRSLAFVLCDIDAFKNYNDHYGHQAGDECLKQVATAMRACCNRPADMAARYGGEEFALVLPDTDLTGATRIAEAAREAVDRLRIPHASSSAGPNVSISGGVAVLLYETNMTAEELIEAADKSLYRAKHEGRNRIVSVRAEAA